MLSKNQIVQKVKCIDETVEGFGIVKHDGQVIFVKNMLMDEQAHIKITRVNKKMAWANIDKFIKKSSSRQEGKCEVYPMCGGCSLLHMKYENQIELKKNTVINNFKKYANTEVKITEVVDSNPRGYRNKAAFPIQYIKGEYITGFYRARTNEIIQHDSCLNQDNEINKAIREIMKALNAQDKNFNLRHIVIRSIDKGLSVLFVTKHISTELIAFIKDNFKKFAYVSVNENTNTGNKIIDGNIFDLVKNEDPVITIDSMKFNVSHNSFFQVNKFNIDKLYNLALSNLDKCENVLELYSGTGTISCLASKKAKHITAIEIVDEAVRDAKKNAKANNIDNIRFLCQDATQFIRSNEEKFDALIIDPPRKGLSSESYEHIIGADPKRIIYISCSSDTLARDYLALSSKYKINKISVVDMFPNTKHIETILVMDKK